MKNQLSILSGFQSTNRANTLAQKVVRANIAQNLSDLGTFYNPTNWAFLNDTEFPPTHDYIDPPNETEELVNGRTEMDSQRFHVSEPVDIRTWDFVDAHLLSRISVPHSPSTCRRTRLST
jgi:hypothetical protein